MATDDSANLAPKADETLFIVRASFTSSRLARRAIDMLYQRQVDVMGLIFNSVDTTRGGYDYYKYAEYYKAENSA